MPTGKMNITVQQSLSRWFKNHFESDKEKELDFTQVVQQLKAFITSVYETISESREFHLHWICVEKC